MLKIIVHVRTNVDQFLRNSSSSSITHLELGIVKINMNLKNNMVALHLPWIFNNNIHDTIFEIHEKDVGIQSINIRNFMNDSHNVYKLTSLNLEEPINHKYRLSHEDID
jgi:hypothetical protein